MFIHEYNLSYFPLWYILLDTEEEGVLYYIKLKFTTFLRTHFSSLPPVDNYTVKPQEGNNVIAS